MKTGIRTLLILLALCLWGTAHGVNPKPFVIPELREWRGGAGNFVPGATTRIAVVSPELRAVADSLAADWQRMFGLRFEVSEGKASKGDIALRLSKDRKLGKEGYRINISDRVEVSAPEPAGVYWATRTLLQIAEQSADRALPKGEISDWPDYALRGLSMDVGRKFFPLDYLKDLVKVLAYYKMNSLRIHLNDNGFPYYFGNDWSKTYAAFRMESDRFPGLSARDGYYTKAEFRDFQRSSAASFVNIVPEIDVPAHSLAFSRYKEGIGSKEFGEDHLDLFNPETMPFIDSLFDEYLGGDDPVFIGEYMHIGTDEFGKDYPGFDKKKETAEKFRSFMDHYIRLVESYGKKPWVWGSLSTAPGETPIKTEGVMLDAWYNGYADPREMVKLGFRLNSIPDGMVYIVPAAGYYHDYLNTRWLYENWTPARIGKEQFAERDPNIAGGYFAVWNDHVGNGVSVQDVHHRVMPAMQTMAVKLWDGVNVTIPFDDFDKARLILSEAPGVNRLARVGKEPSPVLERASVNSGDTLPLKEIGYDYTVEFDLEAQHEEKGTELFRSDDAVFYLSDPVKGMMGFARDGYLNDFGFRPYPGEKGHIRISGTNEGTTLWVNGRKFCSLDKETRWHDGGKKKMYYLRTLVFPLAKAGVFRSRITNLKVYNYLLPDPAE